MSTHGQFNTKSPTIKRILREAAELSNTPSPDYHAAPLETNLFEWHFTLRGPPSPSPFANGLYHGRIVLPATYPLRPPSFRFLTPSGRFEPNREICLSISGHHEESWQPAWGIRTALVAIRSFMDSEAKGQVGGIEAGAEARKIMAAESGQFKCNGCGGRSNREIMKEREEEAAKADGPGVEDKVPEELKLGYRDELGKGKEKEDQTSSNSKDSSATIQEVERISKLPSAPQTASEPSTTSDTTVPQTVIPTPQAPILPAHPGQAAQSQPSRRQQATVTQEPSSWLDIAIIGIAVALGIMVLRKVLSLTD